MKIQKVIVLIIVLFVTSLVLVGCFSDSGNGVEESENLPYVNDTTNATSEDSSIFTITAVERDAEANAASHFNVRIISETFVDTGFGMYDDFGGCILEFELENISGRAVTVDISIVFPREHGHSASLIDQDIHFEPGQTRQFTHSFGEYAYYDSPYLVIEYLNVRY